MRSAVDHRPIAERLTVPPVLSFIDPRLYPASLLSLLAAEADGLKVSPERHLLAAGYCSQRRYYKALADQLGLRFIGHPRLRGGVAVQDLGRCSVSQAAEGEPFDYVIAPRDAEIRALLNMQPLSEQFDRVAITSPRAFEHALRMANGPALANAAAHELDNRCSALSARARPMRSQWITAFACEGWLCFCWASWPVLTVFLLNLLVATIVMMQSVLRVLATVGSGAQHFRRAAKPLADRDLPHYSVLVPLFREARVLPSLLKSLGDLDYPAAKLDIKILVESCDGDTLAALRRAPLSPTVEVVVCPSGQPRTKPRALNIGLRFARGELIVVYDAEDRPDPAQLRLAAAAFAQASARVACLQARLAIDNPGDSWLSRCFALEYAQLFDTIVPGLAAFRLPIPLGGTSNHFRRKVLLELGGWDAWNVTEDADLGLRLARAGYRVDALNSTTWEEAPITLRAWFRQRTRWLKGWMQTSLVHGALTPRRVRETGLIKALVIFCHCYGLIGTVLGLPFFAIDLVRRLIDGSLLNPDGPIQVVSAVMAPIVLLSGAGALIWGLAVGAATRGIRLRLGDIALLPAYYLLASCACWRALWELFDAPSVWAKTEHGLSRTREPKPPTPESDEPPNR